MNDGRFLFSKQYMHTMLMKPSRNRPENCKYIYFFLYNMLHRVLGLTVEEEPLPHNCELCEFIWQYIKDESSEVL